MEQRQLGEAAGRPELLFRPSFQFRQGKRAATARKIKFPHEAGNPDIDGEGVPSPVSVEQDTAGDFRTDAGQLFQMFRRPFRGPTGGDVEEPGLAGQNLGGGGEMFGAVAELAGAQGFFPGAGHLGRRGEIPGRFAEGLPEAGVDLTDLDDLFEGGADEVGQALPRIFPEGPKSRMGLPSLRQPRIFSGAGAQEGVEIEVEAEIVLEGGGREEGIVPQETAVPDRKGDGLTPDPTAELSRGRLIPAKGLPSQQGGGEIQWNGELQGGHDGEKLKG